MRDALLSVLAIVLAAALTVSDRFWVASNKPMVMEMSGVKLPPEIQGAPFYDAAWIPRQPTKLEVLSGIAGKMQQPVTGNSIPPGTAVDNIYVRPTTAYGVWVQEIDFLGMPFGYYTLAGPVLFQRGDWGVSARGITDGEFAAINKANGRDVRNDFYPFWWHVWGWLFVAGVALWLWLRHLHIVRKREAEGMI